MGPQRRLARDRAGQHGAQAAVPVIGIRDEARERQEQHRHVCGGEPVHQAVKAHRQQPGLVHRAERIDRAARRAAPGFPTVRQVGHPGRLLVHGTQLQHRAAGGGLDEVTHRQDRGIQVQGRVGQQVIGHLVGPGRLDHVGQVGRGHGQRQLFQPGVGVVIPAALVAAAPRQGGVQAQLAEVAHQEAGAGAAGAGDQQVRPGWGRWSLRGCWHGGWRVAASRCVCGSG